LMSEREIGMEPKAGTGAAAGNPAKFRAKDLFLAFTCVGPFGFFLGAFLDAVGERWTLAIYPSLGVFWYVYIDPRRSKDWIEFLLKKATRYGRMLFLTMTFGLMWHITTQAQGYAKAHSMKQDKSLPQVGLIWNEPPKPGLPDPILQEALDLKLLWASSSELYVFRPRNSMDETISRIYCIPRDKVRYYTQR
jgi:hypothetical protein